MGLLFGTDGIRGKANTYPITCEIALKAGQAVGIFTKGIGYNTVIIGKDTRISGDMLASSIAAGVASTGINVLLAGVIPTPGVAFLCTGIKDAGTGIVISASHNPYQDNGIKIFNHDGMKLSDEQEDQIEDYILNSNNVPQGEVGKISIISDSLKLYSDFLLGKFPFKKLDKKPKIIIDCSNGAASKIGHLVFCSDLFNTRFISDSPNGKNINDHCGSQHTEDLQALVVKENADIGFAFDGDADRLIAVDEKGNKITGDCILAICAKFAKQKNRLKNNIVVSTIMSNIGLTESLDRLEIQHIKSDVGDRKVLEKMKESGAVIGGEDSGHMIFLDDHSTGDGMLSALRLFEIMIETHQPLSSLASVMTVYPQVLMNVEVTDSKPDIMLNKSIADTIKIVEKKLGDKGRVLIRYSGTQPLLRVMVEGPDQDETNNYCLDICESIRKNI
ncbi:MAG: phosphoglucosamine mutase [Proteobacteria bacterium]|nr:phosphoglucosamine mutase [Pseudomonadota bacterium]MBU1582551.1 phosphoglucosamine mutase [Pseudomonadota bacterium]MBU2453541.1 phosphoglucosamine mutase [Pseudomonadota bacterium]MBU2630959.1 phosphoglucosamine mutase [Pseudomonadota bacterium]